MFGSLLHRQQKSRSELEAVVDDFAEDLLDLMLGMLLLSFFLVL